MSELISDAPIINNFKDDMYCWILDPNSSPQTNRFLLSKFIQEQRITYAVNVGTANAIELVLKSPLTSYVEGLVLYFKSPVANTGAVTVKADALAAIDVVKRDGTPLAPGDLPAGSANKILYDGTKFQLMVSLGGAGSGDMVLANVQTNTGAKTFNDTTLLFRNVADTFNGSFVNTNTADRVYTLQDAAGTLAFLSDITGTNSGTNTGDQTSIVGITGTKAEFDAALTDGDFLYVGDVVGTWIADLTTGTGAAIQNAATSDITAQTGTNTFDGLNWDIDITGRASTGDVNFLHFTKTDTGTTDVFKVDIDGQITSAPDTDITSIFGRVRLSSEFTDIAYFSHFNFTGFTDFALRQDSTGITRVNAISAKDIEFSINNLVRWRVDALGNLDAVAGVDLNLSTTTEIQFGGVKSITGDGTGDVSIPNGKLNVTDRLALGLTTGDVATPLDAESWYNNTFKTFRAKENGVVQDVISVKKTTTVTISSAQLLAITTTPIELIAAPGANKIIVILSGYYSYIFNTTAYSGASNDTRMQAFYSGTIKNATGGFIETNSGSSSVALTYNGSDHTGTTSDFENKAIDFTNNGVDPTLGDGTVEVTLSFIIMDI